MAFTLLLSIAGQNIPLHVEGYFEYFCVLQNLCGPDSSVGIATDYGLDGPGIKFRWGEISSLLYNGYRVFSGGKVQPGHAANRSPTSSAVVMEE